MTRMNWQKAAMQDRIGRPTFGGKKPKKKRGITNKQAQYLAALQRKLGEPYGGNGLTMGEASSLIESCEQRLDNRRAA